MRLAVLLVALVAGSAEASPGFHLAGSLTFFEWKPAGYALAFSPVAGPALEYHFARWDLGLLIGAGGEASTAGRTGFVTAAAPFACLGESFGAAHGSCLGVKLNLGGDFGGIFRHFTWAQDFGIVFTVGPELLAMLLQLGLPTAAPPVDP